MSNHTEYNLFTICKNMLNCTSEKVKNVDLKMCYISFMWNNKKINIDWKRRFIHQLQGKK